ncbi:MAG: diacylglycerol kinase family protein [bacterium]
MSMGGTVDAQRVRVLFNPKSGVGTSIEDVRYALQRHWDVDGVDLTYQVSLSKEDGIAKARRAVEDGVDTIIVLGGDGMVNSIGSVLVGTETALAVIPTGSGNGFARHFDIPLAMDRASAALKDGHRLPIDVGFLDDAPFFVTCSLAWDADLVKGFEEFPIRGILPYVFAGIYHWFTYHPQKFTLTIDGEELLLDKPMLLTVANLTQYGGGARIAPNARPDDGLLELIAAAKPEPMLFVREAHRLFDGTIEEMESVTTRRFRKMIVTRERSGSVQLDGELLEKGKEFTIEVREEALQIIVPNSKR